MPNTTPLVLIVVLNWNDAESTSGCVRSIMEMTYSNYELLIIDNGSDAEDLVSLKAISLNGVNATLVLNKDNKGFVGGCNQGIDAAIKKGASFVWLLNNDTRVAPDALEKLVSYAQSNKNIGLLSPVLYDMDEPDRVQHASTRFDLEKLQFEETSRLDVARDWQHAHPLLLWGTALLIPESTFNLLGGFDTRYFAYSEDFDYSVRAHLAGFVNVTVFESSVWHKGHDGTLRKPHYYYYTTRNGILFWRRYLQFPRSIKMLYWQFARARRRCQQHRDSYCIVDAIISGFVDGLFNVTGQYQKKRYFVRWLFI